MPLNRFITFLSSGLALQSFVTKISYLWDGPEPDTPCSMAVCSFSED